MLGYCTYHDRPIENWNCREHEDGSTCIECQYLFTGFKNPVSVREYAKAKSISEATVRKRIKEGKLKAIKINVSQGNHPKYGYSKYIIESKHAC